ncbi:MAG: biopolymer transporter ExbD [Verrucomicrobiales bacterium]|nr:biopolymer transporter ExbD [Verrucomicrobiales bacterium]MCP5559791.1 biopolymer transporter ExbD [Verrucomicrobiaceae bacterium]
MRRKKTAQDEIGFNITPMIDMTFLLLIFFMVTSKMTKEQKKMDISLPLASSAVMPEDISNRDIVNLDGQGQLHVANRDVTDDEMRAYLKERFRATPPLKIYLRADLNTPAKRIRQFMEMASQAGAVNVIFATYQR